MKIAKKAVAVLSALLMLLSAVPMGLSAAADTSDGYGRQILAQMENAAALLYAYDVIAEASYGTPASIPLTHATHKVTWEEACMVYDLVLSDHPDIFWHGSGYSGSIRGNYAAALKPTYIMTGAELETARAELEAEVVRLTADLHDKSDYEKSLLLHNRLAGESQYLLQGEHQTAYGALVQGTAVCAGYAHAYQLLMQRVGIPTWYVTGTSVSPAGQIVGHAWNLVLLDGEWYYTDVTWDDQKSYTFYAYLNNTSEQMEESHSIGAYAAYLPTATATEHNYFTRNNLMMEQFSADGVADIIRREYPARVYVTGDKETFIREYSTYLFDVCEALNAPPGAIRYGHATLGHEVIVTLHIDHVCDYVPYTLFPTCNTDGYMADICSYEFCHNEQNRIDLPATGMHNYDHNCDPDCNDCGTIRETAGHGYIIDSTIEPTCNMEGMQIYRCPFCDDSYSEVLPATGNHIFDAECDDTCNECGYLREAGEHTYHPDTIIEPTCGAEGVQTYVCFFCGDSYSEPIPATGDHVYDYECDTDCNMCGYLREAGEHTYHSDTIIEPTCGAEGVQTYVCFFCGDSYSEPIPATGDHVYDYACDTDCNECGATRTASHVYDGDSDTECNVCGHIRPTHTPGDVNNDGKVNVRDLGLLQQFLNGWDVTIITAAGDVNGDGKVNVRDLGLLQQFLNGWDVTLK